MPPHPLLPPSVLFSSKVLQRGSDTEPLSTPQDAEVHPLGAQIPLPEGGAVPGPGGNS